MKCRKCHTTMVKNQYYHIATCPCCGRTVHYKTRSEKRRASSYYSGDGAGCVGVLSAIGIIILAIILLIHRSFELVLGDGFWPGVGNVLGWLFSLLWGIISFVLQLVCGIISGLFGLIF